MAVSLHVVGDPPEMHPIVRDEVYLIGYEAISNASHHSRATHLNIELSYDRDVTLRINDNGIGIDAAMLDKGKAGHFGLQSMRERAGRIGGKLTLVSTTNGGTAITLVLPEVAVYRAKRRNFLSRALQGIYQLFTHKPA